MHCKNEIVKVVIRIIIIIIIIIISLFREGNILSKTAYLQYGLHKINKSIKQECQIINKNAKISKHAYISTQHLIIIRIILWCWPHVCTTQWLSVSWWAHVTPLTTQRGPISNWSSSSCSLVCTFCL